MDKTAIQQIQESANIPKIIEQCDVNNDMPLAVVPDSMSIQSLEKYMPTAGRYRLNFETGSIGDFILYNKLHDQQGATCFVDAETMSAKSIFDLGTVDAPGHKENTSQLHLKKSPSFETICKLIGVHFSQTTASNFIEDWSDNMDIRTEGGTTITPLQAALALQNMTIETAKEDNSKVHDFGKSQSTMERIEAKCHELMPAEIHFRCWPYIGLSERTFTLRINILTGYDCPMIVFRIVRLESTQEDIANEFKENLVYASEGLELRTFIGTV